MMDFFEKLQQKALSKQMDQIREARAKFTKDIQREKAVIEDLKARSLCNLHSRNGRTRLSIQVDPYKLSLDNSALQTILYLGRVIDATESNYEPYKRKFDYSSKTTYAIVNAAFANVPFADSTSASKLSGTLSHENISSLGLSAWMCYEQVQ